MNTQTPQREDNRAPCHFDLYENISKQNATRFTKTPPYVLFENVMQSLMGQLKKDPANNNNHWSR